MGQVSEENHWKTARDYTKAKAVVNRFFEHGAVISHPCAAPCFHDEVCGRRVQEICKFPAAGLKTLRVFERG
jgi:hypothetical protein